VRLGPPAVVRLERALAHEVLPLDDIDGAHPSADEHAGGTGANGSQAAAPVPRKLVPAGRRAHRAPCTGQGGRAEPAADSDQHSRGRAVGGAQPDPDRPWSMPPVGRPRRRAAVGPLHLGRRLAGRSVAVLRDRCPAVDEAVSVAVAPRRTSGSRRAGRPRRSPDRRTA
jgi:hypothetical protein